MNFEIKSPDPLNVLCSTKKVLEKSRFVEINSLALKKLSVAVLRRMNEGMEDAESAFGASRGISENAQLIFIEDSVNFCFWAEKDKPKWSVEWPKGKIVTGGWYGLVACFERSLSKSNKILDAKYLSDISEQDVEKLFKSSNSVEIPLLGKRMANLQEAGKVLVNKFDGHFSNLIETSNFDAIEIVKNVAKYFPSYRDTAKLDGQEIYLYKRAQIVAHDSSYIYGEKIKNINLLTAFADYKLPQIFRSFGVFRYNKDLADRVDNYVLIPAGSREEIEIRSATVWGIELIRQMLGKYTAGQIDNAIWLISQDQSKQEKPYHRTYTIFY